MIMYVVLGYVTDVRGATPYMAKPASTKGDAVENWYIAACDNIGVQPDAEYAASAEHQDLIDTAYELRTNNTGALTFLNGEVLTVAEFEV